MTDEMKIRVVKAILREYFEYGTADEFRAGTVLTVIDVILDMKETEKND